MARYDYRCPEHGVFEVTRPMADVTPTHRCPACGMAAVRVYAPVEQVWHCDGAHRTDYDRHGDKLERLNRSWSEITGEPPPPPAREVPRNSSEKC